MTNEEAIRMLIRIKDRINFEVTDAQEKMDALNMAIAALEQEPCIQEKQANADKIDAVYIDGFKAGYSQARFDLEQEPCEDCVSRQAALDCFTATKLKKFDFILYAREEIKKLPSVTPAEKVGRWIMHIDDLFPAESTMECNKCHEHQPITIDDNYCPNCGAKMEQYGSSSGTENP